MSSDELEGDPTPSFEIELPRAASVPDPWRLIAHNKKVIKDWESLTRSIPGNVARCYDWLRAHPMQRINQRCYPLRHKHYAGVWAFEVGSGDRVYYKIREDSREVLIYYAGPHPVKVPYPPPDDG